MKGFVLEGFYLEFDKIVKMYKIEIKVYVPYKLMFLSFFSDCFIPYEQHFNKV